MKMIYMKNLNQPTKKKKNPEKSTFWLLLNTDSRGVNGM